MKIEPLSDEQIRQYYLGSRLSAIQDVARAAQADVLRQVIELMINKRWTCIDIGTLQSALDELERTLSPYELPGVYLIKAIKGVGKWQQ